MAITWKNRVRAKQKEIIDMLSKKGQELVAKAFREKEYTSHSINLDDSLCWGVYERGKLVAFGFYSEQQAIDPIKWYDEEFYGHDLAVEFLRKLNVKKTGYTLVVAATAPYAEILERGWNTNGGDGGYYNVGAGKNAKRDGSYVYSSGLHKWKSSYRVISSAVTGMKELIPHYSGSTVRIVHRGMIR